MSGAEIVECVKFVVPFLALIALYWVIFRGD